MPIIYNTAQSGNVGNTTTQMTNDETPRQSSTFTGAGGGAGGGGPRKGGKNASRVDTMERQRDGNKENWKPLDEKGKPAYLSKYRRPSANRRQITWCTKVKNSYPVV